MSAASATSLSVSWSAPDNAGPAITDYDHRHRTTSPEGSWTEVTGTTSTALSATIAGLADGTAYDVQVRATNDEGAGAWSDSGTGSTDANAAPAFSSDAAFDALENQTAAGTVVASDGDSEDKIERYDITGGADQALFMVIASSGDLEFRDAPNFEDAKDQNTNNTYVVEVQATSGAGEREKTATQTVTVTVTDVAGEAPGKPAAPNVSAASVTSLTVNWSAPSNAGPAITDYDVQYREGTSGGWTDGNHTGTATTATLSGLSENTSHQVQVRATNDEGTGSWSDSGSGATDANAAPAFSSDAAFDALENQTAAGTVVASDGDSEDKIERYDITGGADRALFMVIASSGDLEFRDAPNFEDAQDQDTNNTYVVDVQATSGAGEREKTATQTVTVTVTDVAGEAPGKPAAPNVSAASVTSLTVNWSAPDNAGPAITDYDVQYREGTSGGWTDGNHTGTATTATLSDLPENTSHQVQVRATSDEGTGSWSDSGSGATDANAAPSFSSDAAFDALENQTAAGTVVASDGDTEDRIERYDITGGADRALFMVIASSGDLEFRDAPNFEDAKDQDTNNTYVVDVQATSGAGEREKTATQTVTVTVTDVAGEAPGKPAAPNVSAASATSLNGGLVGAVQRGPGHHRLRRAPPPGPRTSGGTGRTVNGHTEHGHCRRRSSGLADEHLLRRAGAGDQRRGHGRVVGLGHGVRRTPMPRRRSASSMRRSTRRRTRPRPWSRWWRQDSDTERRHRRATTITGGADQDVLLDRCGLRGADVRRGAELRGREGPGREQHLRGRRAGHQRHGVAAEDGDADDHGDGDRRRRRGAGQAGRAERVGGVGDEPERGLVGAGQRGPGHHRLRPPPPDVAGGELDGGHEHHEHGRCRRRSRVWRRAPPTTCRCGRPTTRAPAPGRTRAAVRRSATRWGRWWSGRSTIRRWRWARLWTWTSGSTSATPSSRCWTTVRNPPTRPWRRWRRTAPAC